MSHHILTLNDFMVATRGTTSWALQTGLTPSFTTDFSVSTATNSGFTVTLAGDGNDYSNNSSISITGINCPISIRVASITGGIAWLYAKSSTSSISSTNLRTSGATDGWVQLEVGNEIAVDLNNTVGFGVYKIGFDATISVTFVNASSSNSALGSGHTFN